MPSRDCDKQRCHGEANRHISLDNPDMFLSLEKHNQEGCHRLYYRCAKLRRHRNSLVAQH